MKPRVVITHRVHPEVIELLESSFEVVANQTPETLPREEVMRRAAGARAVVAFMPDRIDEGFLRECPSLKIVAAALKGYDNIDVEACARRGVLLTVCEDLLTAPTAELAMGLLIGVARRIYEGNHRIREGGYAGWRPQLYGKGLTGSIVGIVGMGKIGRTFARLLSPFGVRMLYADPRRMDTGEEKALGVRRVALEGLLAESDFVVLLVHLKEDTLHLFGADALSKMKPGSFLVNVGRGSVVDERAVAEALSSGRLAGYAADVFEMEDWAREDRPSDIAAGLLEHPRTLFTPHLGSAVEEVRLRIELEAARNVLQELEGEVPGGAVNHPRKKAS